MDFKNKKYTDLISGDVVTVNEQFENIALLDNDQRVDVKRLIDPKYFEEYIDPKTFFDQGSYNIFADKIKSISDEVISKMEDPNDSAVIEVNPDEERRLMQLKVDEMSRNMNIQNNKSSQNQIDKLKQFMDEDEDVPVINNFREEPTNKTKPREVITQHQNVTNSPTQLQQSNENELDPILTMFKNIKRNTDFKINFNLESKIPRLDFIEMMEDSYETSIIEYISEEFTKNLIKDPSKIKEKIKEEIKKLVYGIEKPSKKVIDKPVVKKVTKSNKRTIPIVPIDDREEMQEGVNKPRKSRVRVIPENKG